MARKSKRPYGSGCLVKKGNNWVIRWRETEIGANGNKQRVLRWETLSDVSKREASRILAERLATAQGKQPVRSKVLFETLASQWLVNVLPMYKQSTQKNHQHIVEKHLLPRFGSLPLCEMTRQLLQTYIADLERKGYAPKTIDHIHDVLSAVLRTGVKWGHLVENPARGLDLPKIRTVRPKWALTQAQATSLLSVLAPLPRTMVGLCLLTGLSRSELFALRWKCLDERSASLTISEGVYEGHFDTPKTTARVRQIPLCGAAVDLLAEWNAQAKRTAPEDLIFSTRSGKPISPNNILQRFVFPASEALGLPRATWLTFRRSYSSWAHDRGVPDKVLAGLMGHSKVYTTLNVYTQVMDESLRKAVDKIGEQLFGIDRSPESVSELTH